MGRGLNLSGFGFTLPAASSSFALSGQAVNLATGTGGTSGYVQINSSGLIVDQNNNPIELRGSNMFGMEGQLWVNSWYSGNNPWGSLAGPGGPSWGSYGNWKPNFVRIPLSPSLFFNLAIGTLTGGNASNAGWSGTTTPADPNGVYKPAIIAAIQGARSAGVKLILFDVHWSAPKFTLQGVTNYMGAIDQPAFTNYDTDYPFWCAGVNAGPTNASGGQTTGFVAWLQQTFGPSGPYFDPLHGGSTGINDIGFELFNEPYFDGMNCNFNSANQGAGSSQSYAYTMLNGGWCSSFRNQYNNNTYYRGGVGCPNSYCGSVGAGQSNITNVDTYGFNYWWRVAGYQQMVNGIRALGATNIILCNPWSFANAQNNLYQVFPTDTLSPPQLASGTHNYNDGGYPYPTGNATWAAGILANTAGTGGIGHKIPVLMTETGDEPGSGPGAAQPNAFIQYITGWMDSQTTGSVGITDWAWNNTQAYGFSGNINWADTIYGAPISINGSVSSGILTVTSGSGLANGYSVSLGGIDRGIIMPFGSGGTTGTGGPGTYQLRGMSNFSQGATSGTAQNVLAMNGQGLTLYNWMVNHP